jgi:hypothetical protein
MTVLVRKSGNSLVTTTARYSLSAAIESSRLFSDFFKYGRTSPLLPCKKIRANINNPNTVLIIEITVCKD